MSDCAVYLQPAFVLQSRKFRESSLILDVLTEDFGRISLLAKGSRKLKASFSAVLQPFVPLRISFSGRGDLKTLTNSEVLRSHQRLEGQAVFCGFYINELVQQFLYPHDPHPQVFGDYARCLLSLAENTGMELALRTFEINLLRHAGYGLQLDYTVDSGAPLEAEKRYGFYADRGAYEDSNGAFSGKTLLAVQANRLAISMLAETKKLMRLVIDHHAPKPLRSRVFMAQLMKETKIQRDF
ncbi:MAG: DNA repair protein RecO [Gammaproteobacteria bacterium]